VWAKPSLTIRSRLLIGGTRRYGQRDEYLMEGQQRKGRRRSADVGSGYAGAGGGAGAAVATIEASSEGAGTNGGMNAVAIGRMDGAVMGWKEGRTGRKCWPIKYQMGKHWRKGARGSLAPL
jgi:hypothetical protein